jgi:hypothetical protein
MACTNNEPTMNNEGEGAGCFPELKLKSGGASCSHHGMIHQ